MVHHCETPFFTRDSSLTNAVIKEYLSNHNSQHISAVVSKIAVHAVYLYLKEWKEKQQIEKNCLSIKNQLIQFKCQVVTAFYKKSLKEWKTTTIYLPPSIEFFASLKLELLRYPNPGSTHVLLLQSVTFKEYDEMKCIPAISTFLQNYFHFPVTVYPNCKWRCIGHLSKSITWVISFSNDEVLDGNVLTASILKESWNDYYSYCNWSLKRISSPDYMDFLLRVRGGITVHPKKSFFRLRRKHCEELDDVVFDKYSDKDGSSHSIPLLPIVVITFSVLLLFAIFSLVLFIFPFIRSYLPFFVVCFKRFEFLKIAADDLLPGSSTVFCAASKRNHCRQVY